MRYAVIGKGFIYPRHEQAIERVGGSVLFTCDNDPSKEADFTDWLEMFNHPLFDDVEAVSICTPNYLHGVIAREAILRGKKVICEKPLTIGSTEGMGDTKAVLQLRHHPKLVDVEKGDIFVEAKMFRDDVYWDSWKGNKEKSGGILYNLGVHYIDLMIFLLGDPVKVLEANVTDTLAKGKVQFEGYTGEFHIEIVDSKEKQGRNLTVNGKEICLSNQENLSYEDLHYKVYEEFEKGEGIDVSTANKALDLIKHIIND